MSKGLVWALVAALIVTITGYVILKINHVDGADTLAIAMSAIIGVFVGIQNNLIAKDLEKVKNQTNGMTHHIMEENKHLRQVVEPARVIRDTQEEDHGRNQGNRNGTGKQSRDRTVSDRRERSDRDPRRDKGPTPRRIPKRDRG